MKAFSPIASAVLLAITLFGDVNTRLAAQPPRSTSSSAAAASALREAVLTAQRGDPTRALTLTQQLVEQHPAYGPAFKFKGALLEDMGRAAEAQTCYEQALKLTPNDAELLFKVGVNQLVAKDYASAIALLKRAAKETPRDSETLYYLAQAYHLQGDNDLALTTIARSAELAPKNAAVLQKYGELLSTAGNNTKAVLWLRKAQQLDPALDRINLDLGISSFRNQDLEAAADYAAKAVESNPQDVKALQLLAEVNVKLAHWQDAQSAFARLLAISENDPTALLGLGQSELGLKQYQKSIDTLNHLLEQQPKTILAHFYLARAYAGLGLRPEAEHETELHNRLVERAGSIVPEDEREVEKATLLEARQMLAEGHEAQAVQLFRSRSKGPTATPGAPYMLVGVSYLYMHRPDDASRSLKQAIEVEPTVRLAHAYLGMLALQHDDLAEAERQFKIELQHDPNSQMAVAEMGEVRYRQGRWAEAADQLSKSRTVSPDLLYLLTDAYFHLDDVKEAKLTAELAADYGNEDPANLQRLADLLNSHGQAALAQRLTAH